MTRKAITQKAIAAACNDASEQGKAVYLWDTDVKGFGCRITPRGDVSWQLQIWAGGKRFGEGGKARRVAFEAEGIDAARAKAMAMKASGIDPVSAKQERKQAQREKLARTKLKEAWELYYERRGDDDSTHWKWTKSKFEKVVIPKLGATTALAEIGKAEIVGLIDKIERKHPISARYTFACLRPFFKWCVGKQYISASPMDGLIAPELPKARERVLSDDEIKALWNAAGDMRPLWCPLYRLLLLTAQRREEVGAMSWSEVDLDKAIWTIPGSRTKNGKPHTVHLSPLAVATLKSVPKAKGTDYVFTTTLKTPMSGYGRAKARLGAAVGFSDWVVHDLRRTAASGMASLGFQPHIIERVLNHLSGAQGGLVAVYQRHEYLEERKRAIEAWGNYVQTLISEAPRASSAANVVAFPR
jgi:integrase